MELRITPLSHFATNNKTKAKNNDSTFKTKLPTTFSTNKLTTNKSLLILTKAKVAQPLVHKPQLSIKLPSSTFQPININNNRKGVLLYQQIERDNFISNRGDLINRFHFKI